MGWEGGGRLNGAAEGTVHYSLSSLLSESFSNLHTDFTEPLLNIAHSQFKYVLCDYHGIH